MKKIGTMAASVTAAILVGAAPAAKAPPPVANYWMDIATASGMGAGMMGAGSGGRPDMGQLMQMMNSGGGQAQHLMNLCLSSRTKAVGVPQADHLIPPGMAMGASLPLVAPPPSGHVASEPGQFERPKGRMLVYWGCGEHAGAGQPAVIDFSRMAAGQLPPGYAAMMSTVRAAQPPRAGQSAGFGEWPNPRDSRTVPPGASLIGAHRVEGNYAPPIAFSLGQGQDFMPGLGLREAGALPSGAIPLIWSPAIAATGYALSMVGSAGGGDLVMWTSANRATIFPAMDYLSPAQVRPLVASGTVLAPGTSQCALPAEVVKASPEGMVMMVGYGPEAYFSDRPKAPTWTTRVRYKTNASLILGMADMMGEAGAPDSRAQPQGQGAPKKKKKRFGLGDLIEGVVPHP